jgi:hypothetical protein
MPCVEESSRLAELSDWPLGASADFRSAPRRAPTDGESMAAGAAAPALRTVACAARPGAEAEDAVAEGGWGFRSVLKMTIPGEVPLATPRRASLSELPGSAWANALRARNRPATTKEDADFIGGFGA